MKVLRVILLVVALGATALGIALTAGAQPDKKVRQVEWEYRDGANFTMAQLNALGSEGWELAVATQYDKNLYYILKRPKP